VRALAVVVVLVLGSSGFAWRPPISAPITDD